MSNCVSLINTGGALSTHSPIIFCVSFFLHARIDAVVPYFTCQLWLKMTAMCQDYWSSAHRQTLCVPVNRSESRHSFCLQAFWRGTLPLLLHEQLWVRWCSVSSMISFLCWLMFNCSRLRLGVLAVHWALFTVTNLSFNCSDSHYLLLLCTLSVLFLWQFRVWLKI